MTQVPILSGSFTDEAADFRTAMPRNMIPVPKAQGVSAGYLRPSDGIVPFATGTGDDRGATVWNGKCYRVMGSNLVRVNADGSVDTIGDVGSDGALVSFDYSFDRLAIASAGDLYYFDGTAITQVLDTDLGTVRDMIWIDGYFMSTDGKYVVVTDLNNPYSVNPLKYGSSEADPDPIVGLIRLRREAYAINRYTIEAFDNVGGTGFPFERNPAALIQRGALGNHCAVVYMDQLAFLGSGRNEPPGIFIGGNGQSARISTREVDTVLQGYTEAQLSSCLLEVRIDKAHQHLMLHLPDQCLVYDGHASQVVQEPVWFTLDSGTSSRSTYRAKHLVWCYDKWLCGDPTGNGIGVLVNTVSTHYGQAIGWEFGTGIVYNQGMGAVFHQLELVALPGRVALGLDPVIWTSYSLDGETWSSEKPCRAGKQGERTRRLTWLQQGSMRNWRVQKFRGTSDAHLSFARLEAQLEPLNA
jgi:hypothetical protein